MLVSAVGVVWREFLWGGIAGGFGEGMMHPVDTVKTRIQSQAILSGSQVSIQNIKDFSCNYGYVVIMW